jgi:hypothetical protein
MYDHLNFHIFYLFVFFFKTKELDINDLIQERDRLAIRLNLADKNKEV